MHCHWTYGQDEVYRGYVFILSHLVSEGQNGTNYILPSRPVSPLHVVWTLVMRGVNGCYQK